jgi:hypothetical protein
MHHQRTRPLPDTESFLDTSHVTDLLHVAPKPIARRAKDGRLPSQRALGAHCRSPEPAVRRLAASLAQGVRTS